MQSTVALQVNRLGLTQINGHVRSALATCTAVTHGTAQLVMIAVMTEGVDPPRHRLGGSLMFIYCITHINQGFLQAALWTTQQSVVHFHPCHQVLHHTWQLSKVGWGQAGG